MKSRIAIAAFLAAGLLGATAYAGPPEGKGPGHNRGEHAGQAGKGNQGQGRGNQGNRGNSDRHSSRESRKYHDDRGRYSGYFDDRRDRQGHYRDRNRDRDRDTIGDLIDAGITAALARQYAHSAGFDGYSSLPPGIRKNLMRGKPLPPGIAKKVRSGAFLERLPRYSGYEWQTAGTDLILVSIATGVIADILYDVFD